MCLTALEWSGLHDVVESEGLLKVTGSGAAMIFSIQGQKQ